MATTFRAIFGQIETFMAYLMGLVIAATVVNGLMRIFGHAGVFSLRGNWKPDYTPSDQTKPDDFDQAQALAERQEHQAEIQGMADIIKNEDRLDRQYEENHPGRNRQLDQQYNEYLDRYNTQQQNERERHHREMEERRTIVKNSEPSAQKHAHHQNTSAENNPDYT